eukprot:6221513-Pyramimonas_sp.AAC.1
MRRRRGGGIPGATRSASLVDPPRIHVSNGVVGGRVGAFSAMLNELAQALASQIGALKLAATNASLQARAAKGALLRRR